MAKAKASDVRVPVKVGGDLYETFRSYSEVTGIPVARVVREALEDFAATTMAARLEALATLSPRKVVAIDEVLVNEAHA